MIPLTSKHGVLTSTGEGAGGGGGEGISVCSGCTSLASRKEWSLAVLTRALIKTLVIRGHRWTKLRMSNNASAVNACDAVNGLSGSRREYAPNACN